MNLKLPIVAAILLAPNLALAATQASFEQQSKLMDTYLDQLAKSIGADQMPPGSVSCLKGLGSTAKPAALKLTACGVFNGGKTQYISASAGQNMVSFISIGADTAKLSPRQKQETGVQTAIKILMMRRTLGQPLPADCSGLGLVTTGMLSCQFKAQRNSFLLTYAHRDGTRLYYDGKTVKDLTPPPLPDLSK